MTFDLVGSLRAEYLRDTEFRLDQFSRLVEQLEGSPADAVALVDLYRMAHQLAGTAAIFGMADLGQAAATLERECQTATHKTRPDVADVHRWKALVNDMRQRFAAAAAESATACETAPAPRVDGPRILSVEDDPQYSAMLTALLTSAGYVVRACSDPGRFEDELAAFRPDLVLMDVLLPGASGYDLGRLVRQQDSHVTVPVLFLTSQHEADSRLAGVAAGGDDYLLKSDPPALLLATIAARVERARLLRTLLERDGLTQLLTHTAFVRRLDDAVAHHRRDASRRAALAMMDIDHFKSINDRHGHVSGDKVLAAFGAFLRRRLRQSDVAGRYGGEEFAVLLRDVTEEEAVHLTGRVLTEFARERHEGAGGPYTVTVSAGVALLASRHQNAQQWIADADAALYRAKAAGRNRVVAASSGE